MPDQRRNEMNATLEVLCAAPRNWAKTALFWGAAGMTLLPLAARAQQAKPLLPLPPPVVSTVPSKGDVNPYGVAFVPRSFGAKGLLHPGDILVSNFNNNTNLQGTGTTIIRV